MFNTSRDIPKLSKQGNQEGKTPSKQLNRRQRELAERSAMRSSLHLRLPRPSVVKSPSPLSDLMWEIPNPRNRRKSNPSSVTDNVQDVVQQGLDLNRSNSQPESLHHAVHTCTTNTEPNGR